MYAFYINNVQPHKTALVLACGTLTFVGLVSFALDLMATANNV